VFNGSKNQEYTEEDITDPINKYGKSKLLGENAIREISDNYLILRTSWVFSEIGTNFVKKIFSLLKSQKEIKVIDDQIGCPTSAKFIAETTLELLTKLENNKNITEIINICQPEAVSWFDFASSIRDYIQSETIVIPVSSDEFKTKAVRPKNSVLSTKKLQTILEESNIESWRVNLKDVLRFLENENKN
jgi:dTDP-4-dehydrorhamnose reductase